MGGHARFDSNAMGAKCNGCTSAIAFLFSNVSPHEYIVKIQSALKIKKRIARINIDEGSLLGVPFL